MLDSEVNSIEFNETLCLIFQFYCNVVFFFTGFRKCKKFRLHVLMQR